MAKKEHDKSGAMALIVMGALIVMSSLTWGDYVHWVWPIGAIVIFVGVITLQMQRNLIGFHILVTLVLVGLMVTRFTQINQVRVVEHSMTWKLAGTTDKNEGKKEGERIIVLTFEKYPGYVKRLYSTKLAKLLERQHKDKTITARFEVTYDFKIPKKHRVRAVAGQLVSFTPKANTIILHGSRGGRKPDASPDSTPWAYPTN